MAQASKRLPGNVVGDFFVDDSCIDCGACRWIAPTVFGRDGDYAVVQQQPAAEQISRTLTAIISCPVAAIGNGGTGDLKAAANALPEPLSTGFPHAPEVAADGVYYVGHHGKNSFGAAPWLIRREAGNILVDCPRYSLALARRITALGGIDYLFLTHRDDVGDHQKWAEHFAATRILHEADITPDTARVEQPLSGYAPTTMGDDITLIPVPGHTQGSVCLLYKNYLFTGDHLAFAASGNSLIAFDRFCWHDWPQQTRSMTQLARYRFEWVLPGHGAPGYLPQAAMDRDMARLLKWMAAPERGR